MLHQSRVRFGDSSVFFSTSDDHDSNCMGIHKLSSARALLHGRSLTSTLLNEIVDDSVEKALSSRVRGRITSRTYPIRYVWWILDLISGFLRGTGSLNTTTSRRNDL